MMEEAPEGSPTPRHLGRTNEEGSRKMKDRSVLRYALVIEAAESNFSAYVPDLSGCVATGASIEETEEAIREAILFHLEGLRAENLPVPKPSSRVDYVEVAA